VHVVADGPQGFFNSVPAIWEATSSELAIVQLHGRNAETYNLKGLKSSAERFNYLYSLEELRELGGAIQTLSRQARRTHVLFNKLRRLRTAQCRPDARPLRPRSCGLNEADTVSTLSAHAPRRESP
jgi:uncharacterized protein YecE (DUF72 family)